MMTTIVLNIVLGLALIAALIGLLGHFGVRKDQHHQARLHRWHRLRAAGGRRPHNVVS